MSQAQYTSHNKYHLYQNNLGETPDNKSGIFKLNKDTYEKVIKVVTNYKIVDTVMRNRINSETVYN